MCCMSEVDEDIFWEKEVKVAEVEKMFSVNMLDDK